MAGGVNRIAKMAGKMGRNGRASGAPGSAPIPNRNFRAERARLRAGWLKNYNKMTPTFKQAISGNWSPPKARRKPGTADPVDEMGIITVKSTPPDAEVLVDGMFMGTTPTAKLKLTPGKKVEIKIILEGYKEYVRNVIPVAGNEIRFNAKLKKE